MAHLFRITLYRIHWALFGLKIFCFLMTINSNTSCIIIFPKIDFFLSFCDFSSFKQNCPFSLKVNLSRNAQNLVITNIAPDHNHEISETVFKSLPRQRQLSDDQKAEVKEMLYLRCNKKLVRKHMVESTGKNVLLKDIHNLKVIKDSNLESTIKYLESTGGYVEVVAREGKLEGIFFQDEIMKNSFKQNPELVLLDATYCLNSLAMPLYILMVINGNGQGQVAAVFILAHETSVNIIKMLEIFKTKNPDTSKIEIIFTDKDFSERNALQYVFPSAVLLLCFFHTLRTFQRNVANEKMGLKAENRKKALSVLEKIAYSTNEIEYEKNYEELIQLGFKELLSYYNTNWHPIRYEWVRGFMKSIKTFNITTTNHLESLNQKIKQVVERNSSLQSFFEDLLTCLSSIHTEQKHKAINLIVKTSHDYEKGSIEDFYSTQLTPYAWKLVAEELKQSRIMLFCMESNSCTISCECVLFKNTNLPCRHIFFKRIEMGSPITAKELIPTKYTREELFKNYCGDNTVHPMDDAESQFATVSSLPSHERTLSKQEKYKTAMLHCQDIANVLSDYGTKEFKKAISNLESTKIDLLNNNGHTFKDMVQSQILMPTEQPQIPIEQPKVELKDIRIDGRKLKRKGRPKGVDTTVIGLKKKKKANNKEGVMKIAQ
uniref:Zinc finger SWIM domain-containing protein 3 n=1 Tax=Cacopsylla melanoneura TaxID=428564 RepID=A0A8D8YXM5_9HEMI